MRRWETLAALAAVTCASLSIVPIGGRPRPILAVAAIGLIGLLGIIRLRGAMTRPRRKAIPDAYERALRIQEAREEKFRR
jgi:hypothetical protein